MSDALFATFSIPSFIPVERNKRRTFDSKIVLHFFSCLTYNFILFLLLLFRLASFQFFNAILMNIFLKNYIYIYRILKMSGSKNVDFKTQYLFSRHPILFFYASIEPLIILHYAS